jgi:hypothetical protein
MQDPKDYRIMLMRNFRIFSLGARGKLMLQRLRISVSLIQSMTRNATMHYATIKTTKDRCRINSQMPSQNVQLHMKMLDRTQTHGPATRKLIHQILLPVIVRFLAHSSLVLRIDK